MGAGARLVRGAEPFSTSGHTDQAAAGELEVSELGIALTTSEQSHCGPGHVIMRNYPVITGTVSSPYQPSILSND